MLIKIYNRHLIRYIVLSIFLIGSSLYADSYSFRKYSHVKKFYQEIMPIVLDTCQKYKLPAASVLAIAGLESGYGRGYVAQITGNIMSLGAFKSDLELPALILPYSKSKQQILFDPKQIKKHHQNDLIYKKRKKSLKKDYRPLPYAGTIDKLALLKYNKNLRQKAYKACFNDFAKKWISKTSNIKAFRNARSWLNSLITKNGTKILFSMSANKGFIDRVGSIKNSFNYRKTWPKKAKIIMKKTGLVTLVDDIKNKHMSFNQAWEKK